MVVAISGIGQSRTDVFKGELRALHDNLLVAHSISEPSRNTVYPDTHPADTRPATALARLDGDDLTIIHGSRLRLELLPGKAPEWFGAMADGPLPCSNFRRTRREGRRYISIA